MSLISVIRNSEIGETPGRSGAQVETFIFCNKCNALFQPLRVQWLVRVTQLLGGDIGEQQLRG